MLNDKLEEKLFNRETIEENKQQYFEIYKLYVEMADRVSLRRQTANSFFLSINTAIIGFGSLFNEIKFFWVIYLAGLIISYMWYSYIHSKKQLNTAKFRIINLIENNLVLRPYHAEWVALEEGKNKKIYQPLSGIEKIIPIIFCILNFILLIKNFFH